jgi:hypothetical protein
VQSAFASMPHGKASSRSRFREKPYDGSRSALVQSPADTRGAAVAVGFAAPPWGSADALALDALMAVLVDNPLSRAQLRLNGGTAEFMSAAAVREYEPDAFGRPRARSSTSSSRRAPPRSPPTSSRTRS